MITAMATCMDETVGNVAESLKQQGMWDNTLFIFTSGNAHYFDVLQ